VKWNKTGDTILWSKTFGSSSQERFLSLRKTGNAGYFTVGYTSDGSLQCGGLMFLVRTDANGDSLWTRKLQMNSATGKIGFGCEVTTDGCYAVIGETACTGIQLDLLKICDSFTGIEEINDPVSIALMPNPFHDNLLVTLPNGKSEWTITVFNSLGQKILSLETAVQDYELNTSNLPPGIYFLRAVSGDKMAVQKVIRE
jgi:hypothetical protein